ncbi:MAG TPA: hypothetical protein VF365_02195 [Candidatus Limnocylindria bacterium]
MKNRWIGGLLLGVSLSMAACAPPNQGGGASAEPSERAAPASVAPASVEPSAEPMESEEPGQSAAPGGYDY